MLKKLLLPFFIIQFVISVLCVLEIYYGNINCITTFKLIIFNRWGQKVFETTDPGFNWNGTCKSMLENTAVFDYYMKATLVSGEEISKKGNISLIR